ncbi:MAG: DUF4347 domain-containing protein [Nostoc sp.]|uniref:DUF4347 domain-containing protein n=1 Tax=Nostoc sp. TaxID=1180 RepID=UPI002FF6312C
MKSFIHYFNQLERPTFRKQHKLLSSLLLTGIITGTSIPWSLVSPAIATSVKRESNVKQTSMLKPTKSRIKAQQKSGLEIIFVDPVVRDIEAYLPKRSSNRVVYELHSKNPLAEMAQVLRSYHNVKAIHIISHGQTGQLILAGHHYDAATLKNYQSELKVIGQALRPGGDILIYGCNIGKTPRLIATLAQLTGADIAASNNPTGDTAQGGDWRLEVATGAIETAAIAVPQWQGLLWTPATPDSTVGWFGDTPALTPNATILTSGRFSSAGPNIGATGHTFSMVATTSPNASVQKLQNVTATTFAQAVTNNDYIYSDLTVGSTGLRVSGLRINQVRSAYNTSSTARVGFAIVDTVTGTETVYNSSGLLIQGTTNGVAIPLSSDPQLLPNRTYRIKFYLWNCGANTCYIDNPAFDTQLNESPTANNVTATSQANPGGTNAVQVPALNGTDVEDVTLGTGASFRIVTLPTNGTLKYNNVAVTANQVISGYDPTLLTLDPTATGADTVNFTYTAIDSLTAESSAATVTMPFAAVDYGDAPDSYGTLLASNGARHTITGLYLGAGVSADSDGQPNATATGDTNDDGVTFSPTLGANYSTLVQAGVSNQVKVVSSGSGYVNAWIDYNHNGVFDAGEQILTNQAVVAGTNTLTFTPDNRQLHGSTFARFRLSPTSIGSPSPVGLISGGEVEDYQVYVAAPVPDGAACATTGLLNGGFENPTQGANSFNQLAKDFVPGWNTNATDQKIEIWSTPFQGVTAYLGNQFAEINATQVASLYQDIATVPGSTLTFQFAHRARRLPTTGPHVVDTTSVKIGAPAATVQQGIYNTDSTDWVVYRGTYQVPANQYITRFEFNSISSGSGSPSVGNFVDDVNFSVNGCVPSISPPTIDLDGNNSTATGNNYQNTFTVGGAAVAAADTDVVITDDKTNITRAIIQLTTTPDGTNESLTIDPTAGGTVTGVTVDLPYDSTVGISTTGRLTLKGSATLADYQKVLATLKYSNTKASPTMSDRIINVQVIDSDKASSNTAISTIKIANPVTISGTVFSDADADVTINGSDAGTNAGSANLTIYALDTAGKVLSKATVAANGTYSLTNIPANSSVTLRLSNDNSVAIGATAPTASTIPSGWYYTGENKNGTVDGTIATLGNIALTTTTSNLTNENFGIRQAYTIAADAAPTTCNPDYRTALNTGVTAAGGQVAVGANDLNWTAEWIAGPASGIGTPYAPPRPVGVMPAVVVGNLAPGAWINEPANARWISYPFRLSANNNGDHRDADLDGKIGEDGSAIAIVGTSDAVRLKFTSNLTLPSNANTIAISLPIGVSMDNQFLSVKVNGVENLVPTPSPNSQAQDYKSLQNVNMTKGWQAGVNTIEIVMDSGPNLAGFFLGVQASSTQVCGKSNVVLVKRITAINGVNTINPSDNTTHLDQVLDNPATPNDDPGVNWPSGYLVGAFNAGKIKPGDVLEYTVYFLNAKGANANTVKICDRIIGSQTYKTASLEIRLGNATSSISLSDAADPATDRGQFYPSSASAPAACNLITPAAGVADNGTWAVDVTGTGSSAQPDFTTMPSATAPGTPTTSYGFIRFKTIVNP